MAKPQTDFDAWMAHRLATTDDTNYDRDTVEEETALKLGTAIRELREQAGLNQTQLAAVMNTSQPNLARIEAGIVKPTFGTLLRVANVLNVTFTVTIGPHGANVVMDKLETKTVRQRKAG